MADLEDYEPVELEPRHYRHLRNLGLVANLGLALICVSAIWTVQPPTFGLRKWAGLAALAVVLLISAAVSRGRSAFTVAGKLATAYAALLVLGLAYDPQLANIGSLGEKLPEWLTAISPGLAMLGVIIAAFGGFSYMRTINSYLHHRHYTLFAVGLKAATLLVIGLGLATYLCLRRMYELDPSVPPMLISNALQYCLVAFVVVNLSGRIGVGSSMQTYLSLTILAALARNLVAMHGAQ